MLPETREEMAILATICANVAAQRNCNTIIRFCHVDSSGRKNANTRIVNKGRKGQRSNTKDSGQAETQSYRKVEKQG